MSPCSNHSFSLSPRSPSHNFSSDCSRYSSAQRPGSGEEEKEIHRRWAHCQNYIQLIQRIYPRQVCSDLFKNLKWGFPERKTTNYSKLELPAASAINSRVQSASAASPREVSPGVEAESGPERNSAAQSPERANAATSGAMTRKYVVLKMLKTVGVRT